MFRSSCPGRLDSNKPWFGTTWSARSTSFRLSAASPGPRRPHPSTARTSARCCGASSTSISHRALVWDTNHETAVRQGKWKLRTAKSDRHAKHEMVELELGVFLYDLEADPGETTNLAARHPEVLQRLREVHRAWRAGL